MLSMGRFLISRKREFWTKWDLHRFVNNTWLQINLLIVAAIPSWAAAEIFQISDEETPWGSLSNPREKAWLEKNVSYGKGERLLLLVFSSFKSRKQIHLEDYSPYYLRFRISCILYFVWPKKNLFANNGNIWKMFILCKPNSGFPSGQSITACNELIEMLSKRDFCFYP